MTDNLPNSKKELKPVILISILIVLFIILAGYLSSRKQISNRPIQPPNKQIVKVGEEYIYQSDVNYFINNYPPEEMETVKKAAINKLINDSIVLQEAKRIRNTNLEQDIYNSPDKNLMKRNEMTNQIISEMDRGSDRLEGTVVAIWFYNTDPPKIGVENAKKIAYEKITKLHEDVKSGKINMIEAGNIIKEDNSLSQLDYSYKSNAILEFNSKKGETITFDQSFDNVLWNLNEGEVSDIYLLKDHLVIPGNETEALYTFGQVTKKTISGNTFILNSWLEEKKGNYDIQYL